MLKESKRRNYSLGTGGQGGEGVGGGYVLGEVLTSDKG